jgi:hypothetical protein
VSLYKVISWTPDLDLSNFYKEAEHRGFVNNASQQMLVNSLTKEDRWAVWILYYNDEAVGSVAAHSFDDVMGPNSYRIAARTCVFTDKLPGSYGNALRTISVISKHQNPTAQFLIPTCIDWCPPGSALYITTNESAVGTQKQVHKIFGPALERKGIMKKIKNVFYRETEQTVWQIFPDKFYKDLSKFPRW